MTDDLEERAAEAAANARCVRCKDVILDKPSKIGATIVRARCVGTDMEQHVTLCGDCGVELLEFLHPELLVDPEWLASKDALQIALELL
jgi:uncharacterized protein with PIN domain